jgi:hypothetical protein
MRVTDEMVDAAIKAVGTAPAELTREAMRAALEAAVATAAQAKAGFADRKLMSLVARYGDASELSGWFAARGEHEEGERQSNEAGRYFKEISDFARAALPPHGEPAVEFLADLLEEAMRLANDWSMEADAYKRALDRLLAANNREIARPQA